MSNQMLSAQPEVARARIQSEEIDLARRIHRSMLPAGFAGESVDVAVNYREASHLGGDYATIMPRMGGSIFISLCDVAGHGIAAALLSTRVNSFVRERVLADATLCEVVEALNQFLYDQFEACGLFVTFFCAEVFPSKSEIHYAGAGHPPGLLFHPYNNTFSLLNSRQTAVGIFPDMISTCTVEAVTYKPGDRLLLYTDGISEARGPVDAFFGREGIRRFLQELDPELSSADVGSALFTELDSFSSGMEREDDQLVLSISFKQEAEQADSIDTPRTKETGSLLFVYNADSGVVATLFGSAHKFLAPGSYECSLCALTHGLAGAKAEWVEYLNALDQPAEFLHRREFRTRYAEYGDIALPAIFRKGKKKRELELIASGPDLAQIVSLEQLVVQIQTILHVRPNSK